MIPLSLYIHIPWCEKKCPYCDFNSHQAKETVNEAAYIEAVLADLGDDLAKYKSALGDRDLQSIFIGGGTPSLFSVSSIDVLLRGVEQQIAFTDDIEITLEANPGSSESEKFNGFRAAGVNRLSIGIQSFNAEHLKALGRVHNSSEALAAANYAKEAGFDNFNLDLMFGLPQQSLEQCLDDVKQAIELSPTHLSCYQLTIEPNTLFHHQPPVRPDDETLWEMQSELQPLLANNGYQQYEVSAYSQPDKQARHNRNYWQFGDYLGIGAGAHGKVTDSNGNITRHWKIKHPTSYLNAADEDNSFNGGINAIEVDQVPFEFMMNALRLTDGFSLELFEQRSNLPIETIKGTLEKHQNNGLISIDNKLVKPTERGRQLLDSLLQDYLT